MGGSDQNHPQEMEVQEGKNGFLRRFYQIAEKRREAKGKEKQKDTPT